jgi:hypothetical protein
MAQIKGPKHVAGTNIRKYTINSNNNLKCVVLDCIFCSLYTYKLYKNCTNADQPNTTILFTFQSGDMFRLSQSHLQAFINY